MQHAFQILGIQPSEVQALLNLDATALKKQGISKIVVDEKPGYPCRISLQDAEIGEGILCFPYEHHSVNSPYRSSGPVFIRMQAPAAVLAKNEIPLMLRHRLLSLRVYNHEAMMIDAHTLEGKHLEKVIQDIFSNVESAYIQVHNAGPGCYNCQINRVNEGCLTQSK